MTEKQNEAITMEWYERYVDCVRSYQTPYFYGEVKRYVNALINLDHGKGAVRDKALKYMEEIWIPETAELIGEISENYDPSAKEGLTKVLVNKKAEDLFHFVNQTIQDSGFHWPTKEQIYERE